MASSAYDYSLFEARDTRSSAAPVLPAPKAPQRKRKSNVVHLDEKKLRRSRRQNAHMLRTVMNLGIVLIVVAAIGAVVFSQVQLTELTDRINTANKTLTEEESLSVQLQMMAASKMNTDDVELVVQQRLGMEKATAGQTSYISLSEGDEGAVLQKNTESGLLGGIWEEIVSIFS